MGKIVNGVLVGITLLSCLFGFVSLFSNNVEGTDRMVKEQFNEDVFTSGEWERSGSTVSVDTKNSWLRIGTGDGYDDRADKNITLSLPIIIESRTRLVSGGNDYRLPWFIFYFESGESSEEMYLSYLPDASAQLGGWNFNGWTLNTAYGPSGENVWTTIRAVIYSDGGKLLVRYDDKGTFTYVLNRQWSLPDTLVKIRFEQPWDSICDMDYIKIQPLFDLGEDGFSFPNYGFFDIDGFGGHCFGMAEMSILLWDGRIDIHGFNPSAVNTYALSKEDFCLKFAIISHHIRLRNWINTGAVIFGGDLEAEFTKLKSFMDAEIPVILIARPSNEPFKNHAVVAYSMKYNEVENRYDINLYDPNQPGVNGYKASWNPNTSSFHMELKNLNGATCAIMDDFVVVEPTLIFEDFFNILFIEAECPLELSVLDSNDHKVGLAISDNETHLVIVSEPKDQDYKVKLLGTGAGDYYLTIARAHDYKTKLINSSGKISLGEIVEYDFTIKNGELISDTTEENDESLSSQFLWIFIMIPIIIVIVVVVILLEKRKPKPL